MRLLQGNIKMIERQRKRAGVEIVKGDRLEAQVEDQRCDQYQRGREDRLDTTVGEAVLFNQRNLFGLAA
jgi:hypothetical protein